MKQALLTGLLACGLGLAPLPALAQTTQVAAINLIQPQSRRNELTIESRTLLHPEVRYLAETRQIIVDLPDSVYANVHHKIERPGAGIDRIRISQYENNPPKVRLVYDLNQDIELSIRNEQLTGHSYRLSLRSSLKLASNVKELETGFSNTIHHLSDIRLQGQNLVLEGTGPLKPEIRQSKHDKKRYYIILYNCRSGMKNVPFLASNFIENVQLESKNDRTVLAFDLRRDAEIIPHNEGNTSTIQFFVRAQSEKLAKIQNVEIVDMAQDVTRIRIYTSQPFDFELYPLTSPDRLVLDTLGTVLDNSEKERKIISNLLEKIRFGYLSQENQNNARLVFDLKGDVTYQYKTSQDKRVLEIMLSSKRKVVKATRRAYIVLDAGHGGNDPGAIGPGGTQEKDVNLSVVRYLQRYLEKDNFQVVLSRSSDLEVLLQPRVDVANQQKADLFISIHCNAMPKQSTHIKGLETYYTTPQSLELARILHQHLLKELGSPDRGVRKRNLFVTRKTSMPSVLLEIGFVSNMSEEQMLANPGYQRRVAGAIYQGIHQYLLLMEKKSTPLKL